MRKDNNMEINFGARIDKSMKKLIHSANMATKNKPYQRGKLMLGLDRIKNAPFEKISYVDKGDVAVFEFLSKYSVHQMVKNPVTNKYVPKVTHHEYVNNFDTQMPQKDVATTLLKRLSRYLSVWDEGNDLW